MPHARAVETAAQFNQVLRTEDGVGFEPTFTALSEGFIPAGRCDSMPHARAVETAAQYNQVLRTEGGVGFEPTFADLSKGFIPAGSVATACGIPARLKPLLRSTKSCGLKTESVPNRLLQP
jgi:hypothetical protein